MGLMQCLQRPQYSHRKKIQHLHGSSFQQNCLPNKNNILTNLFSKKLDDNQVEFILSVKNYSRPTSDLIKVQIPILKQSISYILGKTHNFRIQQSIILDPNNKNKSILRVINPKTKAKYSMKLISFDDFETDQFKQGIYQLYILKEISKQNSRHFINLKDSFIIHNQIVTKNSLTLVILMQPVDASLHQIIWFRKQKNLNWTDHDFNCLMYCTTKSLQAMHNLNIAHRDIRPGNIFYSGQKMCYSLGNLSCSKKIFSKDMQIQMHSVRGVPLFFSPGLKQSFEKHEIPQVLEYDPLAEDVYRLGLSLLQSLTLETTVPAHILIEGLDTDFGYCKYFPKFMGQDRISRIEQLSLQNPGEVFDEKNLVQSLRYKVKSDSSQYGRIKQIVMESYYQLFIFDKWLEQAELLKKHYQFTNDQHQLSKHLMNLGIISKQINQHQISNKYLGKASQIFLYLGEQYFSSNRLDDSIIYFEKGIECIKRSNSSDSYQLAILLRRLAQVHQKRQSFQQAKAFHQQSLNIIAMQVDLISTKGQNSPQYARQMVYLANIEITIGEIKVAEKSLKKALRMVENGYDEFSEQTKAKILGQLGECFRQKAFENVQKQQTYRQKAQQYILDALQTLQKVYGTAHVQISNVLQRLGNVYFDIRDFHRSKKTYQRALVLKQNHYTQNHPEVGELLICMGNACKGLRQYQKSKYFYSEAVKVFRKCYGNDNNINISLAIGNLGLVSKQNGQVEQGRSLLQMALKILRNIDSEAQQKADYIFFNNQLNKIP